MTNNRTTELLNICTKCYFATNTFSQELDINIVTNNVFNRAEV